jgi:hypothetical protein
MVERFGWAQSLYYKCRNYNDIECVRANLTSPLEKIWAEAQYDKTFLRTNQHNCVSAADFERNIQVYLGAQQCGGGRHESRVMAGMLGMHHNALKHMWGEIASRIGLKIINLGKEVMAQNRAIEMALSPTDEGGKATVSLCGDARWDNRTSGRNCSSISGCALALGYRLQLVWDAEPMSNLCIKCMKGIPHDKEACPKNVDCTAKTIEHLEGLSCAPHRNSVPWGTEFFIKRPSILCCFWENSVPFDTVVCNPPVPPNKELCRYPHN